MAILTINQFIDTAQSFINNVANSQNSYYVFYGKPDSWVNETTGLVDDTAVPASNGSVSAYQQQIYKDLVFGKLITSSDVSLLIPKYVWANNTVYSSYDQTDASLYDKQFFVINDSYEVYKCIDNNNSQPSTVMPSLASTSGVFSTGDGYVWKFMFKVDSSANAKFTTSDYIPVTPNTDVITNSVNGSIDFIKVIDGGNNYQAWDTGFLQSVQSPLIVRIANTASPTNGRYVNSSMYLKTGFGSGQLRQITNYDGLNRLITVSSPFDTYTVFNVENVLGSVQTGLLLTQRIDNISFLYSKGFFNSNDTIIQSDTQATATILTSNNTVLKTNKTSSNSFVSGYPIYNTTQSAVKKSGKVNMFANSLQGTVITFGGSGYASAPSVTITANAADGVGAGANATAHITSSGRVDYLTITANGTNYSLNPVISIAAPSPILFSGNSTSVNVSGDYITLGSNAAYFANGDQVTYIVAASNTSITGLSNNTQYYIVNTTSTTIQLASTLGGSPIDITAVATDAQPGHSFKGQQATATTSLATYIVANTGTSFTSEFAVNDFVRLGENANVNIRRVTAVNSSVITVDMAFPNTANVGVANVYSQPYAALVTSSTPIEANGIISNTNLNSFTIKYENPTILALQFTVGERIDMVGSDNIQQGANGTVSFSNSSAVIIGDVTGTFLTGSNNYLRGASSLQKAHIQSVVSFPTITIQSPSGNFTSGQQVYFRTLPDLTATGNASIISSYNAPNELTEYIISPTVTITGDGSNALAYAVVNTTFGSSNNITNIVVLNPGVNYTYANVAISSNGFFGYYSNGVPTAVATAKIAPLTGHGSDAQRELGARYVGVRVILDSGINESFKFPIFGKYRKLGIIENPMFNNVVVSLDTFDRAKLSIGSAVSNFSVGEYVQQTSSNAIGKVVYANNTFVELSGISGTFTTGQNLYGFSSNTTANVTSANISYFQELSTVEIVNEKVDGIVNSGSIYGQIDQIISNTQIRLTNVAGRFQANALLYDTTTNSYANVASIFIGNGTIDATSTFGLNFSQLARLPLSTNTGSYVVGERIIQEVVNASATVMSTNTDFDISYTNANGSFNVGDYISTNTLTGNGIVTYANSSYLRITAANGTFESIGTQRLINNLNIGADIVNVYSVLVLNDVSPVANFQTGQYVINGQTSKAVGRNLLSNTISYPELVRNSGSVIYLENIAPLTRANTTKEQVNLIIKF